MKKSKVRYINMYYRNTVETIDEFDFNTDQQIDQAYLWLKEYRMNENGSTRYRLSQRATKEWYGDLIK